MKHQIDRRLEELIPCSSDTLYAAARYSLLSPRKRLRPSLVLAAAQTFGPSWEPALDVACAIEMIHAYSLIHDDLPCMDDDDLRRGKPTLHKVYPEGMALLAGDYLLTFAFETISRAESLTAEQRLLCIQILSQAAGSAGMIGGQASDIESAGQAIPEEALLQMHRKKTGALIAASLQCGAAAGGCCQDALLPLETLGMEIGLAFQFLDDLLDATSNSSVLGKIVQRDAAMGKATAVSLYGIEKVEKKLKQFSASISSCLNRLPGGAPLIKSLIEEHLWKRMPAPLYL